MKTTILTTTAILIVMASPYGMADEKSENATVTKSKVAAKSDAKESDAKTSAAVSRKSADTPGPMSLKEVGELRAKIHATRAELAESETAKKPDQTKIAKLTKQLDGLRAKMHAGNQLPQAALTELKIKIHRATAALITAQAAKKPSRKEISHLTKELELLQTRFRALTMGCSDGNCPSGGMGQGVCGAGGCPSSGQGMGMGMGPGRGQGMGYGRGQGMGYGRGQGQGNGMGRGQGGGQGQGLGKARPDS